MRRHEPAIERLQEFDLYRDTGCDLHPSCLKCPLPRCRYDEPGWLQREERESRDTEVMRLKLRQALSVDEIAGRFGVSTRTVHRILKRASPERMAS